MGYNKDNFNKLIESFEDALIRENGEPISCRLHECSHTHGTMYVEYEGGEHEVFHVADACNIAGVISSIDRILSLPRSNIACEELSEVLLTRLDVLREYIASASKRCEGYNYLESDADKLIRRWAGFLKHPSDYVFAHRCFSADDVAEMNLAAVTINDDFLKQWDSLKTKERDKKKVEFANQVVLVKLPEVKELSKFFVSAANHIDEIISAFSFKDVA